MPTVTYHEIEAILSTHRNFFGMEFDHLYVGYHDFSRANLCDAIFINTDLQGATFEFAQLCRAQLYGANLQSTIFREANLYDADFGATDLRFADMRYANLQNADLSFADLRGADLTGANMSCAQLQGTNLQGATMPDGQTFQLETELSRFTAPQGVANTRMIRFERLFEVKSVAN